MKLAFTYDDHHSAGVAWEQRDLKEWITDVFEAPSIRVSKGCTTNIREHVTTELLKEGWAMDVKLVSESQMKVTARKSDVAFQLQTGNASRAPYDLLKLEYLFKSGQIEAAAIAIPTREAAKKIAANVANAERLVKELKIFDRVITVPLLVVAFK